MTPDTAAIDRNLQTAKKGGVRSSAQKAAAAKHGEQPVPAAQPVDGAFGQERRVSGGNTSTECVRRRSQEDRRTRRSGAIAGRSIGMTTGAILIAITRVTPTT